MLVRLAWGASIILMLAGVVGPPGGTQAIVEYRIYKISSTLFFSVAGVWKIMT